MAEVKLWRAINRALHDGMAANPDVILLGEDVASPGGAYGLTRGLLHEFGPERVRDTPISEAALLGCAVGAALMGLRPVVEVMFMDFLALALDQLVNQAAKQRFYLGEGSKLPLVVHTLYGGRASMGAQHSQSLEAWVCHVPGLTVAFPSTPQDAYSVLRAAIDADRPMVVIESISLLTSRGRFDPGLYQPGSAGIGSCRRVRTGERLTVVSYGPAVGVCERALDLAGVQADLLDLCWLQPWDFEAVRASVRKTSRLLVVHDAVQAGGWGAEVSARIAGEEFWSLDAPPRRVGAESSPIPVHADDWSRLLPGAERVAAAIRELVAT